MMFLSGDATESELTKLGPVKLLVTKEDALRLTQGLFLEGRQINALYICTHDELKIAEKRKLSWHTSLHDCCTQIVEGNEAIDFLDEVTINVLKDSAPIEALSEQFHSELNQRLERLRTLRRVIENSPEFVGNPMGTAKHSRTPSPQPAALFNEPDAPVADGSGVTAIPSDTVEDIGAPKVSSASPSTPKPSAPNVARTKIMLVLCSRNGTARQALCRFAKQMNLDFEIVDFNPEHPARIVEHIHQHRDAKFAVVYWGEPNGRELPGSAHPERYVGFSLGFVLGRLGRGRVFVLGSTTTPPIPGFTRVLVSQLDSSGGWQIQLARRMKAAGVDIDLNSLT